jgi:hypothetical protein
MAKMRYPGQQLNLCTRCSPTTSSAKPHLCHPNDARTFNANAAALQAHLNAITPPGVTW